MKDHTPQGLRYPWENPPQEGMATQVAPGVLWMRLPLPMKLDHVNIYALDDGDSWTVVDTGFASRRTKAIWRTLMDGPLQGKPITRVIVTHHHPDHVGLAGWLQSEFGAELLTTRTAWLFSRMLTLDEQAVPSDESIAFYQSAGMDPEVLARRRVERPFNFADVVAPMPLGFTRLKQGDVIEFGGRHWDIHIGNGHAPEHATFWSRDDNLVIAGDQILPSISPNIGVYATEPMADPIGDWLESCERFAGIARPDHLVLGGHKLPFTGLPMRLSQLIDNHHGALHRLLAFIDTPKAAGECFAPLFKRSIGDGEYGLALVEAVAHLSHLYQSGLATRTRRGDGAWVYQRKE
ncbi:MBL fold hydrolase [Roseobacter denitrificans]|uniref:Metallo-beta-lactamase family protein n=1 Tax=Roseobacter denitrificans (strain ATCC 33942 / OCh 114) TaxID=375451 RepID=Q163D5_ROSDO|nr:MBL fold metallo-hydrolase [Roseobacter denitrificans]ABG32908.1 metallo-beta-lactamase family protein [Roseobacter denitrificans OCh 114]AVL52299.1 MBL fold hydrolase [Roseobacter denitrificans]SFG45703.1 Glyoxylase, beta-lactamase superfamily II [Roseobacter denitrificans OCh 114]